MNSYLSSVKKLYFNMNKKYKEARKHFNRPITYSEKILSVHMKKVCDERNKQLKRKVSYAKFFPDRVAMQDATAQMAILQFINTEHKNVSIPSTIHCDHLIEANSGAVKDLKKAMFLNKEIYDFLYSACKKYGIDFWKAGSGIIHQVLLENYAFPGGMLVGTDSHTTNAGGLGMFALGVGGSDAVDVMSNQGLILKWPGIIGVHLIGNLTKWVSPKDVILHLMSVLTVNGGTGYIIEFFGDGCKNISATGKATITNMGAEYGATTSLFPYDDTIRDYLYSTKRNDLAVISEKYQMDLQADFEVYNNPHNFFDKVLEINLSTLEPYIVGPDSPDSCTPISMITDFINKNKIPNPPTAALIGSCTNSSYQDISRVASIANFASKYDIKVKIPLFVTPGSDTIYSTIVRDKQAESLIKIGAIFLSNSCGPCIGQWRRYNHDYKKKNSIISSYNRNFPARNDGSIKTLSFIASPEIVTAIALSGNIAFNPIKDSIILSNGKKIKIPAPTSNSLPDKGFEINKSRYISFSKSSESTKINIKLNSKRLSFLKKFSKFTSSSFANMPVLFKAKGKCTTDHISKAGSWLKFRGHLGEISKNTYLGVYNSFYNLIGQGVNPISKDRKIKELPNIAYSLRKQNISWAVVGDENFGEGSSREHAAMQPRYLGCKVIIVKSFARIHETNLKKHGILPLTFNDIIDYDKFKNNDRVTILNVDNIASDQLINVMLIHENNAQEIIKCKHSLSSKQIKWLKSGSALNYIALKNKKM